MSLWKLASLPFVTALLVTLTGAAGTLGAAPKRPSFDKPLNVFDSAALERARSGAAERLLAPACSRVLTDFQDGGGRTLAQNLEPWSMNASDYLRMLPLRDGATLPQCRRGSVVLATVPGFLPVYVCPAGVGALNSRFAEVQARAPSLAEFMLIHEMLHTLGLGENPPSTFEITQRVRSRCH